MKVNDDGRTTDGRRTTDDGQRMITIVHLSLRLRCTKKGVKSVAYPVAVGQKVTKNLPVSFYSPTSGFKLLRTVRAYAYIICFLLTGAIPKAS